MKNLKTLALLTFILALFISCKTEKKELPAEVEVEPIITENYIDVLAKDYTFTVADSIPSGWSTFRMKNTGMMDHFFLLTKLPDTVTIDDYIRDVAGAFGVAWEALKANKSKDVAFGLLGENLPEWYASARAMGGAGLISSGEVAINTLKLDPGYYVMECYIKTENGQFHTELGMITPLIVTKEESNNIPPQPNFKILLDNENMATSGNIVAGENIFSVKFNEQTPFGLGNDIHIAKVNDTTNLEALAQWMDWSNIDGMVSPGAPAKFVGGTQEMPVGYTAYFKCILEPGNYVFIAETPIGRIKSFSVK